MKGLPRTILLGLLLTFGCAPRINRNPGPTDPLPAAPPVQSLTHLMILGLQRPPNLVQDPDSGNWLQPEVLGAYQSLQAAAAHAGWRLVIVSGYRSFGAQRAIWNRKVRAYSPSRGADPGGDIERVMKYTSIPGISRHHWGTDLDLGEQTIHPAVTVPAAGEPNRMRRFYDWLELHAPDYGFCRAYRGGAGAIQDEPWHWSYVRLAASYAREFQTTRDFDELHNRQVEGSDWIEAHFQEIKRLQIDSVDPECNGETEPFDGNPHHRLPKAPPEGPNPVEGDH